MKKYYLIGLVSLLFIGGAVYVVTSTPKNSDNFSVQEPKRIAPAKVKTISSPSGMNDRKSDILKKWNTVGPQPIPSGQFSKFLEENRNDPAAWAAVFDLSADSLLLKNALEAFPHDRRLLVRAIFALEPVAERTKYINDFLEKFPDESAGYYAASYLNFTSNSKEAAVENLNLAISKKAPVVFDNEDAVSRRAALRTLGLSDFEIALKTFTVPADTSKSNGLRSLLPQIASAGLPEETVAEFGLAYCVHLKQSQNKSGMAEHFAGMFEEAYLKNLPPDLEYGDTGQTIADKLKAISNENQSSLIVINAIPELWHSATTEEIQTWTEAALAGGEIFAYTRWFTGIPQDSYKAGGGRGQSWVAGRG